MAMKTEQVLCMRGGSDEYCYAKNSRLQAKAILEVNPLIEKAIQEIYSTLAPERFVAADLGCSSGPNSFLVISEISNCIDKHYRHSNKNKPEILFFLNDLPSNDFNHIFQLLTVYKREVKQEKGSEFVPFYVVGLPGSFYGRLFPSKSVHFFHSSYCLMWLSQVPDGLEEEGAYLNKWNIYINEKNYTKVHHLYLEQFNEDFSKFLKCRSKELIIGGSMILSFIGRNNSSYLGGHIHFFGLISEALCDLVSEGLIDEDKLNAFNMPFYTPLMEEVNSIIEKEGSFQLSHAHTFDSNWDPYDESTDDFIINTSLSGENVARYTRAIFEPILTFHFGNKIMDDLFSRHAKNVARHMSKGKPKYTIFVLSLKLKDDTSEPGH